MASITKINELNFLSPYYPIIGEDIKAPIDFFFTSLNILTETQFDSVLKITDLTPVAGYDSTLGFKVFKSIFTKKEEVNPFEEKLLSYKAKEQDKLNLFSFVKLDKARDKKYAKERKSINFITGCRLNEEKTDVILVGLSLDSILKQIKIKTLLGKVYNSKRYDSYLALLNEQYNSNKNKIIPLQEARIITEHVTQTTLSQLKDFLIPGCKAHKIGELINTIKTSLEVKEFKKSKHFGRVYELRGEAIRYFYNEKNYTKLKNDGSSVLHNSCMRYDTCFEQLKFYSNNPDTIALLVVMDKDNPRQIAARTILWTTVYGEKAIDRIYSKEQEDINVLITYCKNMGYKTVHSSTACSYGLPGTEAVVHIEDPEDTGLPYFDSMHSQEKLNNLLASNTDAILKYCETEKLDYILQENTGWGIRRGDTNPFNIKGKTSPDFILDIYKKPIKEKHKIIAVDLPYKGYLNNEQIEMLGYPLKKVFRTAIDFIKKLKTQYNCIAEAKCRMNANNYVKYIDDKKNLVYSTVLKTYINKEDSYFNYNLNGYIYKESFRDPIIKDIYVLRKFRSIYSHKEVSLTEEGYNYFKKINESLVVPFNIIKVRPSRKFKIQPQNIQLNGVIIKDIIIPFKYLKTIKRNGENKE